MESILTVARTYGVWKNNATTFFPVAAATVWT